LTHRPGPNAIRYIVTARLDRKRRAVTVAEASIPHARAVWARDTIHTSSFSARSGWQANSRRSL
jgi:hypothetical protein